MLDKPVALIDELGNYKVSVDLAHPDRFRFFTTASASAGRSVARHLLAQGHRTCAYISIFHEHAWSRKRLKGIVKAFADAGFDRSVTPLVNNRDDFIDAVSTPEQQSFAKRTLDDATRLFPNACQLSPLLEMQLISLLFNENQIAYLLHKLFTRALGDPSITAWICANDTHAAIALRFLAANTAATAPRCIAVTGFDDTPSATEMDLTSYYFAPATIIEKAVGYLVYPRQEYYKDKTVIEVEGLLIVRGSTGKKM